MQRGLVFILAFGLAVSGGCSAMRDRTPETPRAEIPDTPAAPPTFDPGDDRVVPGELALYPTLTAVGLELPYTGDANANAQARFVWRHADETAWRDGVDFTIDRDLQRMWASIWPLEPGRDIDVRVTLHDPDPLDAPIVARTTTRTLVLQGTGDARYVCATAGDDANPGTSEAPFATIGRASQGLRAGDTVYVRSGIYREELQLRYTFKGTPEQPITFMADAGHTPILEGSVIIPAGHDAWQDAGDGIYATPVATRGDGTEYVAQDDSRMYLYRSLEDLKNDPHQVARAFFYDGATLYVKTGGASHPSAHRYDCASLDFGFYLEGCKHVVIRGFEIRHYRHACIRVSGTHSTGSIVYENTLRNSQHGVFVKDAVNDLAIWRNHVYEPGLADFNWNSIKRSNVGRQGINIWYAGSGISVCHNRVHGWFDGIVALSWLTAQRHPQMSPVEVLAFNRDLDVMFNTLWNFGDDAIEMDGGGVNMRVHGNRIRNAHTAISLAPIERGPVYVTRNEATYHALLFKLSVGADSVGWTYCYHNSGYTLNNANGGSMIRFNDPRYRDANRVFYNNAMIGSEWSAHRIREEGHWLDHNSYFNTPQTEFRKFSWGSSVYTDFETFQNETGLERNGLYTDPRFRDTPDLATFPFGGYPTYADVSIGDLRLRSDSPLINAGRPIRGINADHHGTAPDIGAFEFEPDQK